MTIVRWDPFRDFGFTTGNTWVPPVDIYQTGEHELVLKAELPELTREDIDITVENFVLTIKGEKKRASDVKDELQPVVLAAENGGLEQGLGRLQKRRTHRAAPAARRGQAAADQGGRRRLIATEQTRKAGGA